MSTVAKVHYWEIVNDDTMDSQMVQELIWLLEKYLTELEFKEQG